ncbi:MAG: hypothetical protein JXB49_10070 [Bacteroidales bacterium]|nr:hypothetical protein [Bacteroidales bacterium]
MKTKVYLFNRYLFVLTLFLFIYCYLNAQDYKEVKDTMFSKAATNDYFQTKAAYNTFYTDCGYISLGPGLPTWAHINTDVEKFYFNKSLVSGTGEFCSYLYKDLKFNTSAPTNGTGTTRMTIKYSNGNVGIGTTNPGKRLDIQNSDLEPAAIRLQNTGFTYNWDIYNDLTTCDLIFSMSGYDRFMLSRDGLAYFGDISSFWIKGYDDDFQRFEFQTETFLTFKMYDNSNTKIIEFNHLGDATFEGKITAEEIEVKADVWADDVFNKDYNLNSIREVEEYIKQNNHLPDVPSEKEVMENGINLGDMDAVLLRKVEELTLYIIELKKENEELRELIINK